MADVKQKTAELMHCFWSIRTLKALYSDKNSWWVINKYRNKRSVPSGTPGDRNRVSDSITEIRLTSTRRSDGTQSVEKHYPTLPTKPSYRKAKSGHLKN